MENVKEELKCDKKGITLISLVVTIVVLLILAGVTVVMLIGENGILTKAQNAKDQTEKSSEKEKIQLAYENALMLSQISNKDISEDDIKKELDVLLGDDKTDVTKCGEAFDVLIKDKNYYYTIEKDGKIEDPYQLSQIEYAGDITKGGRCNGTTIPYEISCIEDLVAFSNMANGDGYIYNYGDLVEVTEINTFSGKKVQLTRSLNFASKYSYENWERTDFGDLNGNVEDGNKLLTEMTTGTGFTPIGSSINAFKGIFNGNNNVLKNLYEDNNGYAGLFSFTNCSINDLTITGKIICDGDYVGSLIARSEQNSKESAINCKSYVTIIATGNYVGGIIGSNGRAMNCYNYGEIKVIGNYVGGIAAGDNSVATNCYNYGNIEVTGTTVGGICAGTWTSAANCKNYGKITGSANSVGGICGGSHGDRVNCENYGDIAVIGNSVGGIYGGNSHNVNKCINYANIEGTSNVGGIGGNMPYVVIKNSCNYGNVKATEKTVGGIFGYGSSMAPIINCYNAGDIEGGIYVGEIAGRLDFTQNSTSKIINCYGTGMLTSTSTLANKYIGGVIGAKTGYGTHYVEHCYWPLDFGISVGTTISHDGILDVDEYTKAYSLTDMKEKEEESFLKLLNDYVDEYNSNEENTEKLLKWKFDNKTGYPILNFSE